MQIKWLNKKRCECPKFQLFFATSKLNQTKKTATIANNTEKWESLTLWKKKIIPTSRLITWELERYLLQCILHTKIFSQSHNHIFVLSVEHYRNTLVIYLHVPDHIATIWMIFVSWRICSLAYSHSTLMPCIRTMHALFCESYTCTVQKLFSGHIG